MKTTCLHLQKGGVGKTSISGSLACELTKRGKTILIDVDPQGNSSSWFLTEAPKHELAEVLQGKIELDQAIVKAGELDLIPTFGLDGELKLYGESKLADEPFIFCDLVEELEKLGYDFVILDLSPGIGRLEKSAILSADEVITPLTPDTFSLDGLEIFAHELQKLLKSFRKSVRHNKLVINAYDGRIKQHQEILEQAKKTVGYEKFVVPVDPAFRKAQSAHLPIQDLKGSEMAKNETLTAIKKLAEVI